MVRAVSDVRKVIGAKFTSASMLPLSLPWPGRP